MNVTVDDVKTWAEEEGTESKEADVCNRKQNKMKEWERLFLLAFHIYSGLKVYQT